MSAEATRSFHPMPGGRVAAIRPVTSDPSLAVIAYYGDADRWLPCAHLEEVGSPWAARPTPLSDGGCTVTKPEDGEVGYRRHLVWRVPVGDRAHVMLRGHLTLREREDGTMLLVFTARHGRPSGDVDPDVLQRTVLLAAQDLLEAATDGIAIAGERILATMAAHPATGS